MASCGSYLGSCGHKEDCPDIHCPGRFPTRRVNLIQSNSTGEGEHVDTDTDPPITSEAVQDAFWIAVLLLVALIALGCVGMVVHLLGADLY